MKGSFKIIKSKSKSACKDCDLKDFCNWDTPIDRNKYETNQTDDELGDLTFDCHIFNEDTIKFVIDDNK